MPFVDEETAKAYRAAWDAWFKQIEHLNRVFLEGEKIGPEQIKGLLTRESKRKEEFDAARLKLLGLDEPAFPGGSDDNPFR
jgi:cobalamin biosynthesis protein CbiG